jgi:hypothetical protein
MEVLLSKISRMATASISFVLFGHMDMDQHRHELLLDTPGHRNSHLLAFMQKVTQPTMSGEFQEWRQQA